MQYALVDGERKEATPGTQGTCPSCGAITVAKCGPRVVHHWAHAGRRNCDPWWENETDWHRAWKNLFPPDCREITHSAPDGEIHRADIKTQSGIYIEVQHSPMTDAERLARENFYGNLVWVVDGRSFKNYFDVYHMLPDPDSEIAKDLRWYKATRPMRGAAAGIFWRPSENPNYLAGVEVHGIHRIQPQIETAYRGHHQYDWVRPRQTWLDATCPVYIDFGDDRLIRLEIYDQSGLRCVRLVSKRKFVHDATVELSARQIATRFYPIS